jgi:uncharacterized tellurite resistance protein B-like protein
MTPAEHLRDIARSIANADPSGAEGKLRALLRAEPVSVTSYVFGAALAARSAPSVAGEANLYLRRFDVPQIHLFNLLAQLPFVGLTSEIANRCIAQELVGRSEATIIDIGIGTGRQMTALLEQIKMAGSAPRLTIVGIEPADWALEVAKGNILGEAQRLGIDVTFEPICAVVERVTRSEWSRLARLSTDRPVINASFALHLIGDIDKRDVRDDVLLRLRSLNPSLVVVSESNVDHLESDFLRRFDNCLGYFSRVFESIDALPFEQHDKDALKVCFFGREVVDIVGGAETRSERHESTSQWHARLARTGYSARIDVALPASGNVIAVNRHDSHASLDFESTPLTSVICARPTAGTYDVQGALERSPGELRKRRIERPIDIAFYLAALYAVAHADGNVHPSEAAFIEEQARIFGVEPQSWRESSFDALLARAAGVDRATREAIVRDLVFLARVDAHYSPEERRAIETIAAKLGLTNEDLTKLEDQNAVPPILAGGSSWVRKLWFLGFKG